MLDGSVSGEFTHLVRIRVRLASTNCVSVYVISANSYVLQVTNRCIHMRWRFRTWPNGTDLLHIINMSFNVTFADLHIAVLFRALCYH